MDRTVLLKILISSTMLVVKGQVMMSKDMMLPIGPMPLNQTVPGSEGAPTPLSEADVRFRTLCERKCKTELCYLADESDCRIFITCQRDKGSYYAIVQPCAFGTYWAGLLNQQKITCDLPQNVLCNINYCFNKSRGAKYEHLDGNCKTYWECDGSGTPVPMCCPEGYMYSNRINSCVEDRRGTCHDRCPIKIDACLIPGTTTEYFDDGNCRTYWDCEDQHPHPVCCPEGQGYDVVRGCIDNPSCKDVCPEQYEPDVCIKPGVEKYSLIDGSCRTYMKCNPEYGDERWCCPSNFVFFSKNQTCVERTLDMNLPCTDSCPRHYKEECQLKSVPSEPDSFFIQTSLALIKRPCAPGTLFDLHKCGCAKVDKNFKGHACNKELQVIFNAPMWRRSGSEKEVEFTPMWHKRMPDGQVITTSAGDIEAGPKFDDYASVKFTGELFFRIPFFQSQYDKLYIKVVYFPEASTSTGKMVLLSNCMNLDLGAASMELALENNRVVLTLTTAIRPNTSNAETAHARTSVPYTFGSWNSLTAIYDGESVLLMNQGQGKPTFDRQPLTGSVSVAAEGLDVGGCYTRGPDDGYVGAIAQLEFSKCLRQQWIDDLYAVLSAPR